MKFLLKGRKKKGTLSFLFSKKGEERNLGERGISSIPPRKRGGERIFL